MNNLTNQSIINANEQTYLSLLVSLEAGVGMLQIFIAVCDADRQRENIIANYEQELAPNYNIYRVYLDSQEPSLKQAITQQVTLTENAIAIVLGAETLGSFNQNESLKKFFGYLQWTREALRELKMPIILWIPSRIYDQIPKQAPDFWSWRNGVFHFQPELSLVQGNFSINQSLGNIKDNQEGSVFSPEQLEASLAEAIQQWGADSSKTEVLYSQLGTLYAKRVESAKSTDRQKELTLAQEYLEKAIVLQTKFQKLEALATSLNNLAVFYDNQGKYSEAEPLLLDALEMRKQLFTGDHPDVASSLNNLALLYHNQGKYSEAEPLYLDALEMTKRLFTGDHPDVASSLNNLALLYHNQGKYSEAEPLYLDALEMTKRLFTSDHPDVAISLNNLASLYYNQGRYSEAEPLYLDALEMRKRLFTGDHPDVATSLNNLASLYDSQGRYSEAEPLYLDALEMTKRLFTGDHPDVATSLNNLASLYDSQGRYSEAEPLYLDALEMTKRLFTGDHPDVATSLNNLAYFYYKQGKHSEAEPLYLDALAMSERTLGANHRDTITVRDNLRRLQQQITSF
ncbi:tetratricopeptide repeat protein [Aphanizomenon flos-aquae NRERC-008]|uniref:Tetratricopeptide repeat protein n=1 Tax=Aphanizomenon flos-aquae FACHB-1249 TaxID=2692889 RepID=A0ABR8IV84_APHFL|nr:MULTISPECIES: tetratricopeptide repeat protein [Aphanizomenon]MBD2392488.1 tetratricopeptide repeat protein [Aphanizomenon flos-aquae FACHB-1171]MBD2631729.1 tetratricopeptide repeat protein [Aphanizomenon sp. FACHB-1399]MBD2642180.1 tetratricopeptide repeat protein [Aphanizomenon sp. FACHB-1401]MBD2659174.1 tetratricopeptide repeat protein [Aphanizomenon flos-aquae FACHB-1265]MBD2675576.1 tetratricopeptide repeat protein [Aphanizomenon flos-aquae FACHB-1416]